MRVCRLLLYFLDRPELGYLILESSLCAVLNEASKYKLALEQSGNQVRTVLVVKHQPSLMLAVLFLLTFSEFFFVLFCFSIFLSLVHKTYHFSFLLPSSLFIMNNVYCL